MQLTLPALPPFSFSAVVRSHGWAQLAPFDASADGELTYVQRLDSDRVIELRMRETVVGLGPEPIVGWTPGGERSAEFSNPEQWMGTIGAKTGVVVEVPAFVDPFEQAQIARDVPWMLGLDQDLSPFYALARSEPKLVRAEARAQGRVLRSPTLFEDAVKTMLTVNTSWAGTIRMVEALVEQFGDPLPADPTRRSFPTPERVADADEEILRSRTRLGFRAPSVLQLARSVASGALDLEALKRVEIPTAELRQRLLAIRGIGPYAAANLLMILGRYDFIPVDSWAMKMVSREWHAGGRVGPAEVEAAFERWGEWQGLAYWFWDWSGPPA
jgi:3-methyladenine DNA glycosylase/8-oxoguanine DNA glycosylase